MSSRFSSLPYFLKYLGLFSISTFEDGSKPPTGERSGAAELSQCEFHVEQWNADKDEHDGVRYEKHTSTVTVTQVREPPHVAQTHRVAGPHTDKLVQLSLLPT